MGGLRITPDIALAELRPEDSAMLILAGGDRWDQNPIASFRAAARSFLTAGVPVAAICGATYGLALEGLLDDRAHSYATPLSTWRTAGTRAAAGTSMSPR